MNTLPHIGRTISQIDKRAVRHRLESQARQLANEQDTAEILPFTRNVGGVDAYAEIQLFDRTVSELEVERLMDRVRQYDTSGCANDEQLEPQSVSDYVVNVCLGLIVFVWFVVGALA